MSAPDLAGLRAGGSERRWRRGLALALAGLALLVLARIGWELRPLAWLDAAPPQPAAAVADLPAEPQARGAYLARVGHCAGCHTAPGGPPLAGGRAVATPFGSLPAANLTPDPATGLGGWTAEDLGRALRHGRRPDGGLIHPVCPTDAFALLDPADVRALHAHLQAQAPVVQPRAGGSLPTLLRQPLALAVWRALYRRPPEAPAAPPPPRPGDPPWTEALAAEWARGAYLVRGPAHCQACHVERNALGGPTDRRGGGPMPARDWFAPSLHDNAEAGVGDWPLDEIVALLRDGHAPRGLAQGPMAQVVLGSTQHLSAPDLRAMALYLQRLAPPAAAAVAGPPADPPGRLAAAADPAATGQAAPRPSEEALAALATGPRLYAQHCAACHGAQGEGVLGAEGVPAVPPLAGSRMIGQASPANLLRVVLEGGFGPATAGHPQPFGMPPFDPVLSDAELLALIAHLRTRWGPPGLPPPSAFALRQLRERRAD